MTWPKWLSALVILLRGAKKVAEAYEYVEAPPRGGTGEYDRCGVKGCGHIKGNHAAGEHTYCLNGLRSGNMQDLCPCQAFISDRALSLSIQKAIDILKPLGLIKDSRAEAAQHGLSLAEPETSGALSIPQGGELSIR